MTWDIADRHVLITGGTSGIGRATASKLAQLGAQVTITSRNADTAAKTARELESVSGGSVSGAGLDLASLDSVREFAAALLAQHDRLDVLINNAGIMAGKRQTTVDGNELTFGVNHLGPFLLTGLLTDLLRASSPSRVINVSSGAHRSAKSGLNFDDLQMSSGYSSTKAYAASKLANILFTIELDRRLGPDGVLVRALHPGIVATSFGKDSSGPKWMGLAMSVLKPVLRTPEKGATTSVYLATAPRDSLNGGLYWADAKPAETSRWGRDPEAATRLWDISTEMVSQ